MEAGSAHKLAREPLASECFAQVARLSEDPVVRARAMIEQATILSYSGDWEQAEKLVEQVLCQLSDLDTAVVVEAETMRAYFQSSTPGRVDDFLVRRPVLDDLVARRSAGSRPLAMLLAVSAAQRDESTASAPSLSGAGTMVSTCCTVRASSTSRTGSAPSSLAISSTEPLNSSRKHGRRRARAAQ